MHTGSVAGLFWRLEDSQAQNHSSKSWGLFSHEDFETCVAESKTGVEEDILL